MFRLPAGFCAPFSPGQAGERADIQILSLVERGGPTRSVFLDHTRFDRRSGGISIPTGRSTRTARFPTATSSPNTTASITRKKNGSANSRTAPRCTRKIKTIQEDKRTREKGIAIVLFCPFQHFFKSGIGIFESANNIT